jgi:hypothetical protein
MMGSNYHRTERWLKNCGKEPSEKNLSIQIGVHLEETMEFIETVNLDDSELAEELQALAVQIHAIAAEIKRGKVTAYITDREAALDALCDAEVTGNGVAFIAGFNKPMADLMVLKANDDKLVNGKPVILEGGKIGKPRGWMPPDLSPYV